MSKQLFAHLQKSLQDRKNRRLKEIAQIGLDEEYLDLDTMHYLVRIYDPGDVYGGPQCSVNGFCRRGLKEAIQGAEDAYKSNSGRMPTASSRLEYRVYADLPSGSVEIPVRFWAKYASPTKEALEAARK